MKARAASSKASLRSESVSLQIVMFLLCGGIGIFAIITAAFLPDFFKVSAEQGSAVFRSRAWWGAVIAMLFVGIPGYFFLKVANAYADALLYRLGLRKDGEL